MQALHAKKLEQALRCHDRFPINLEWMVDVFKYKHISSLTTHLKRHFKMNVHYKRFSQEQNKRVWTYFISVECFIGICEYVRHAARKKIANVWLRKVGIKSSTRRVARDRDEFPEVSEEDEEEVYDEDDEIEAEEDQEYDYYAELEAPAKRRRIDDDDEYHLEEEEEDDDDEEDEERSYFQEMEEEEAAAEYETDDSFVDYDSSSAPETPPQLRNSAQLMMANSPRQYRSVVTFSAGNPIYRPALTSSGESSSSCSSPPSSPVSPRSDRPQLVNSNGFVAPPPLNLNCYGGLPVPTAVPKFPYVPESVYDSNAEMKEQVDWSYLHLRQNPHPLGLSSSLDSPRLMPASPILFPPYCYYAPQLSTNYLLAPNPLLSNCHWIPVSTITDSAGFASNLDQALMEDRPFDTNMFLSFAECSHAPQ